MNGPSFKYSLNSRGTRSNSRRRRTRTKKNTLRLRLFRKQTKKFVRPIHSHVLIKKAPAPIAVIQILGKGNDGVIIEPSLDNKPNYISKIGDITLEKEYKNIQSLPVFDELYLNPNLFSGRLLTQDEIVEIKKNEEINDWFKRTTRFYNLEMPKIEGKSLYDLYNEYENVWRKIDDTSIYYGDKYNKKFGKDPEIMSLKIFIEVLHRLQEFNKHIEKFNNDGFFHNDLTELNIMINYKRMYLIDFKCMTIDKQSEFGNDTRDMQRVIKGLLDCGVCNPGIIEYLGEKKVQVVFNKHGSPDYKNVEYLLK